MALERLFGQAGTLRVFSRWHVIVGSIFGGIALGCLLLALNYQRIGSPKSARILWWGAAIAVLQMLVFPSLLISLMGVLALGYLGSEFQRRVLGHPELSAELESWWSLAAWCAVAIGFWVVLGVVFLTGLQYASVARGA